MESLPDRMSLAPAAPVAGRVGLQMLHRNLAAVNVWAMLQAMDPSLPAWERLTDRQQRRVANAVTEIGGRVWFEEVQQ